MKQVGHYSRNESGEAVSKMPTRSRTRQKEMLQWLARRDATSVDEVLARELEDVACAYAEELASAIPGFRAAMEWPGEAGDS